MPLLTEKHIQNRLKFSVWYRRDHADGLKSMKWMFSDEKIFTINGGLNKQNDRVYALSREEANLNGGLHQILKFPMSVMIWCGLTENGATRGYAIEKGQTVDTDYYRRRILPFAKREGFRLFGNRDWVYQQDGATCHTSVLSQNWCATNFKHFLPKEHWPAQSPDLNPLDYFFWNAVVTNMIPKQFNNLAEFTTEILRSIDTVPIEAIRNAIRAFPTRVRKVEDNLGGYCHNID